MPYWKTHHFHILRRRHFVCRQVARRRSWRWRRKWHLHRRLSAAFRLSLKVGVYLVLMMVMMVVVTTAFPLRRGWGITTSSVKVTEEWGRKVASLIGRWLRLKVIALLMLILLVLLIILVLMMLKVLLKRWRFNNLSRWRLGKLRLLLLMLLIVMSILLMSTLVMMVGVMRRCLRDGTHGRCRLFAAAAIANNRIAGHLVGNATLDDGHPKWRPRDTHRRRTRLLGRRGWLIGRF